MLALTKPPMGKRKRKHLLKALVVYMRQVISKKSSPP